MAAARRSHLVIQSGEKLLEVASQVTLSRLTAARPTPRFVRVREHYNRKFTVSCNEHMFAKHRKRRTAPMNVVDHNREPSTAWQIGGDERQCVPVSKRTRRIPVRHEHNL